VIVKSAEMASVVEPVKAYVIPNGVDVNAFRPLHRAKTKATLGWNDGKRRVLFPGNPDNARKGYRMACDALEAASQLMGEDVELVKLWGVEPVRVPLYMNGCDVMLLTSLIEGSPNVVKEAMACNLAVVSVPVGDVPELLKDAPGYAVCSRDPLALAESLVALLKNETPVRGREAIERKRLDLESVAHRITDIYKSVVAENVTRQME
jgi:glycosyltransferase involved in cell wall biosynthesis